jgi:type II secretory pathway predicted ATPase ExeA
LFELFAYDLGLQCRRDAKTQVLVALTELLLERAQAGGTTVLIVDEAHNLEWDVLEEIRLLGNLENRHGKMLQIVLAGQQEFDCKLNAPEYRQLKQRIALRCVLKPFDASHSAAYVESRLRRAGMTEQTVFSTHVLQAIHERTQGIPRLINAVCDNLLLTAFAMESRTATIEMLDEVTTDMQLGRPGSDGRGTSRVVAP